MDAANKHNMLSCKNLTIGYGTYAVQTNLQLELERGEMVCMLGPNGGGKSTLLRTIAGLQPALGGEIRYAQQLTNNNATPQSLAQLLSFVLTDRVQLEHTTVEEVVAMGRFPYTSFLGGMTSKDKEIVATALEQVDMGMYASRTFDALSDGERQRVLIAKALAQSTELILLDEPTAHLDLPNRIRILQLLRRIAHEQHKTILISTHELDLAVRLSDRILLLSAQGIQLNTAEELMAGDAFTKAFGMDIFHPL